MILDRKVSYLAQALSHSSRELLLTRLFNWTLRLVK